MYQIVLKGAIETKDPDKLVTLLKEAIDNTKSDIVGEFATFQLAPYVDYQKIDDSDT